MTEFGTLMFALAVSVYGIAATARNIYWGRQSDRWPKIDGEVMESFLRGGFGLPYWPVVRYGYQYEDRRFTGSRIRFAHTKIKIDSKNAAQAFIGKFHSGARLTIRVKPSRPALSVIYEGNRFANWVELVFGLLFGAYIVYRIYEIS